jgi:hypothetical protein
MMKAIGYWIVDAIEEATMWVENHTVAAVVIFAAAVVAIIAMVR